MEANAEQRRHEGQTPSDPDEASDAEILDPGRPQGTPEEDAADQHQHAEECDRSIEPERETDDAIRSRPVRAGSAQRAVRMPDREGQRARYDVQSADTTRQLTTYEPSGSGGRSTATTESLVPCFGAPMSTAPRPAAITANCIVGDLDVLAELERHGLRWVAGRKLGAVRGRRRLQRRVGARGRSAHRQRDQGNAQDEDAPRAQDPSGCEQIGDAAHALTEIVVAERERQPRVFPRRSSRQLFYSSHTRTSVRKAGDDVARL